ncbi:MAG: inhibitor of cysteine peptidase, partial [Actinoplanes sp.]|nr:inhibitor of cysteine peptidase [Actinoplanes sp.]
MSRRKLLGLALAAAIPLAGCTAAPAPKPAPAPVPAPPLRLVAFDTCAHLLTDLRKATAEAVGPWGLPGSGGYGIARSDGIPPGGARTSIDAQKAAPVPGPAFSGTNNHEADADEPDIVKTDGRRIVTIQDGTLRVIDATTHKRTAEIDLGVRGTQSDLLLSGDHALVLASGSLGVVDARIGLAVEPTVVLVDLSGAPKVVSRFTGEGSLLDARQTGTVARVVLKSAPRINLPQSNWQDEQKRVQANRKAVAKSPIEAWLPTWSVTTNGVTTRGSVGCDRVSRPTAYSGTSMLTVLTFDLAAPALGAGDPVTIAADADTVYGTGSSLYLAGDQRWRLGVWPGRVVERVAEKTDLYRFDLAGAARPAYAASGTVPGYLVNQYALSEYDGHLRVATTTTTPGAALPDATSSAIRVLTQQGSDLQQTGIVDGLGKGERIYSVRFIGPRGYVVTFKQTDPLYTVDLSDPARPTVTGALKINGYSAHLQPVGDGRLVGIGQDATAQGMTQGTQVSLFDVSNPADPRRLAQHIVQGGWSAAEFDPHALLWWPATQLLVVPMTQFDLGRGPRPKDTAMALRVTGTGLTEVGAIKQPVVGGAAPTVRRTLVVGDTLWTMSDYGLQASNLSTLDAQAWL